MKLTKEQYDALPDGLKSRYGVGSDGMYVDQAHAKLSDDLTAARAAQGTLQTQVDGFDARLAEALKPFEGFDAESARKAMETQRALEHKELLKSGDVQGLIDAEKLKWTKEVLQPLQAELLSEQGFTSKYLIAQTLRKQLTAGEKREGQAEADPVIDPARLEAVEAWLKTRAQPEVLAAGDERRAVVNVNPSGIRQQIGLDVYVSDFLRSDEAKPFIAARQDSGGQDHQGLLGKSPPGGKPPAIHITQEQYRAGGATLEQVDAGEVVVGADAG
jgi:hypothetical protein